jgi:hypothetical protein
MIVGTVALVFCAALGISISVKETKWRDEYTDAIYT